MSFQLRTFLLAVMLFIGLPSLLVVAKEGGSITLIDDNDFERGFVVWSPRPKMKVRSGELIPIPDRDVPVWKVSQWHSKYDLGNATRETIAPSVVRYADGAKSVTFDFSVPDATTLTLALDGTTEYASKPPERGAAWPHLLVERSFIQQPALSELASVPFCISYRLLRQEADHLIGWDEQRHTAQFQLYITVRNQNQDSTSFGDFLWFGVPMYDARYRHTPARSAVDFSTKYKKGTGKLIFKPASEQYTDQSAHDGGWITLEQDLLPQMKEALRYAWDKGFLGDSSAMNDYHLGGMNIGWEVTGTINVAMQVKGLSLRATRNHGSDLRTDTTSP